MISKRTLLRRCTESGRSISRLTQISSSSCQTHSSKNTKCLQFQLSSLIHQSMKSLLLMNSKSFSRDFKITHLQRWKTNSLKDQANLLALSSTWTASTPFCRRYLFQNGWSLFSILTIQNEQGQLSNVCSNTCIYAMSFLTSMQSNSLVQSKLCLKSSQHSKRLWPRCLNFRRS